MKNLLISLFTIVLLPVLVIWHVLTWMVKVTRAPHFNAEAKSLPTPPRKKQLLLRRR